MVDPNDLQTIKQQVLSFWRQWDESPDPTLTTLDQLPFELERDFYARLHQPLGDLAGWDLYRDEYLLPLRSAFGRMHREMHLFFGGLSNGRRDGDVSKDGELWITGTGLLHGNFDQAYLGISPTHQAVSLRWGEFLRFRNGRLSAVYLMHDLVDFCEQIQRPVLPISQGRPGIYSRPAAADGIQLGHSDPSVTQHSLAHIREFLFEGLNAYDQSSLKSMGMERFFHPHVAWYGPGGIGACLGLSEFQSLHQQPWLTAFPDRQVQDLTGLFAEGMFTGSPGWAAVLATHRGPYLGSPATGSALSINGLDWWKREGDRYIENWVFVDMVHLFQQMGVNLLARARGSA
ncbi:MAG: hypothetical protein RLY30_411 [Pseudomonadota bacterium]